MLQVKLKVLIGIVTTLPIAVVKSAARKDRSSVYTLVTCESIYPLPFVAGG